MTSVVLVLNCGSSSVKFALIDPGTGARHLTGLAERVGSDEVSITAGRAGEDSTPLPAPDSPDHHGVVARILHEVEELVAAAELRVVAIGHRIAHGGERFDGPALLTPAVREEIRALSDLAPLHNPANLAGVEATSSLLPDVPSVGVFDTAFHHRMPPHSYRYAVAREWYTELGVRRYGFHGTSHGYVAAGAARILGRPLESLRLITAHLGNGCSLAAVLHGRSVDTSMGLTPLEGVVMGTRSGDVDPGLHGFLVDRTGMSIEQVTDALNRSSGLLGVSGISNDMREVRAAADQGDPDARLALDVFGYRLAKYVASFLVPLGGLDALVFTGGIGENSAQTRAEVVARLGFLGWRLDPDANAAAVGGQAGVVTVPHDDATAASPPPVAVVVPTDEEYVIATQADAVVRACPGGEH